MQQYTCILLCASMVSVACARAVLDPAIYLSPGPPLAPAQGETSPEDRWVAAVVEEPAVQGRKMNDPLLVLPLKKEESDMEKAETFWSGYRSAYDVPVSFNAYGTYGNGGLFGTPVGNYPGVVAGTNVGLAGSGYASYTSDGKVPFSGWGNGYWGHYGG